MWGERITGKKLCLQHSEITWEVYGQSASACLPWLISTARDYRWEAARYRRTMAEQGRFKLEVAEFNRNKHVWRGLQPFGMGSLPQRQGLLPALWKLAIWILLCRMHCGINTVPLEPSSAILAKKCGFGFFKTCVCVCTHICAWAHMCGCVSKCFGKAVVTANRGTRPTC